MDTLGLFFNVLYPLRVPIVLITLLSLAVVMVSWLLRKFFPRVGGPMWQKLMRVSDHVPSFYLMGDFWNNCREQLAAFLGMPKSALTIQLMVANLYWLTMLPLAWVYAFGILFISTYPITMLTRPCSIVWFFFVDQFHLPICLREVWRVNLFLQGIPFSIVACMGLLLIYQIGLFLYAFSREYSQSTLPWSQRLLLWLMLAALLLGGVTIVLHTWEAIGICLFGI